MKALKSALALVLLMLLFCVNTSANTHIPILLYHNVLESYPVEDSIVTVTPQLFEEHVTSLVNAGYTPISFDEYLSAANGTGTLPAKPVIITLDDGYETNYTYAYPVLKKHNVKATIFAAVKYMGETPGEHKHFTWEQAREMQQSGLVSIQSHTYGHENMLPLDAFAAEREIRYSKYLMEKNLGVPCNVLAFPYGFHTDELIARAKNAGYDLTVQVGNYGQNTLDYSGKSLVRITVYGSWSGNMLLHNMSAFRNR